MPLCQAIIGNREVGIMIMAEIAVAILNLARQHQLSASLYRIRPFSAVLTCERKPMKLSV